MAETYKGWTNRETWAVALHLHYRQESVYEALREVVQATDEPYGDSDTANFRSPAAWAGDIIREDVENYLNTLLDEDVLEYRNVISNIGKLWRVNWTELGEAFLSDLDAETEEDSF